MTVGVFRRAGSLWQRRAAVADASAAAAVKDGGESVKTRRADSDFRIARKSELAGNPNRGESVKFADSNFRTARKSESAAMRVIVLTLTSDGHGTTAVPAGLGAWARRNTFGTLALQVRFRLGIRVVPQQASHWGLSESDS